MPNKLDKQRKSTLEEIPILNMTLITKNSKKLLAKVIREGMKIGDLTDKKLILICFRKTIITLI